MFDINTFASLAILVLFLFSTYNVGRLLVTEIEKEVHPIVFRCSAYFLVGLSLFILGTHLLSFITQSFKCSAIVVFLIVFAISTIDFFFNNKTLRFPQVPVEETPYFLVSFFMAIQNYFRVHLKSASEPFQISFSANIASNNTYPPRLITNTDISFDFYHYGVDLIEASLQVFGFELDLVNVHAILMGLNAFLVSSILISIVVIASKSKYPKYLVYAPIFFTSFNFIEFLPRYFPGNIQYFSKTLIYLKEICASIVVSPLFLFFNTTTSIACALTLLLVILYLRKLNRKIKTSHLISLTLISCLSYFCFPAYWYAAVSSLLVLEIVHLAQGFKQIEIKNFLLKIISLLIGKFLCFIKSATQINGIEMLEFKPHLFWDIYGVAYLRLFYSQEYINSLFNHFNVISSKPRQIVSLFSSISFREFGIYLLISLVVLCFYLYSKKSLTKLQAFFFLASIVSIVPVFLFIYTPANIELVRFLAFSRISSILFITISLSNISLNLNKWSRVAVFSFGTLVFLPGFVSALPLTIRKAEVSTFSKNDKLLVSVLRKYHKNNDVILRSIEKPKWGWASSPSHLAGYYTTGGIYQIETLTTAKTAIFTLAPSLLKELGVTKLLLNQNDVLSPLAIARLNDSKCFKRLEEIALEPSVNFILYEFNFDCSSDNYLIEYAWSPGLQKPNNQFSLLNLEGHKFFKTKIEADEYINSIRDQVKVSYSKLDAAFLLPQAIPVKNGEKLTLNCHSQSLILECK